MYKQIKKFNHHFVNFHALDIIFYNNYLLINSQLIFLETDAGMS